MQEHVTLKEGGLLNWHVCHYSVEILPMRSTFIPFKIPVCLHRISSLVGTELRKLWAQHLCCVKRSIPAKLTSSLVHLPQAGIAVRNLIMATMLLSMLQSGMIPGGVARLLNGTDDVFRAGAYAGAGALIASVGADLAEGFLQMPRCPPWLAIPLAGTAVAAAVKALLRAEHGSAWLLQQFLVVAACSAILHSLAHVLAAFIMFLNMPPHGAGRGQGMYPCLMLWCISKARGFCTFWFLTVTVRLSSICCRTCNLLCPTLYQTQPSNFVFSGELPFCH